MIAHEWDIRNQITRRRYTRKEISKSRPSPGLQGAITVSVYNALIDFLSAALAEFLSVALAEFLDDNPDNGIAFLEVTLAALHRAVKWAVAPPSTPHCG